MLSARLSSGKSTQSAHVDRSITQRKKHTLSAHSSSEKAHIQHTLSA